jgi:hypothetical protein
MVEKPSWRFSLCLGVGVATAPLSGSFKSSFRPTASASPKSGIPFLLIFSFPSVSLTGFDYP